MPSPVPQTRQTTALDLLSFNAISGGRTVSAFHLLTDGLFYRRAREAGQVLLVPTGRCWQDLLKHTGHQTARRRCQSGHPFCWHQNLEVRFQNLWTWGAEQSPGTLPTRPRPLQIRGLEGSGANWSQGQVRSLLFHFARTRLGCSLLLRGSYETLAMVRFNSLTLFPHSSIRMSLKGQPVGHYSKAGNWILLTDLGWAILGCNNLSTTCQGLGLGLWATGSQMSLWD